MNYHLVARARAKLAWYIWRLILGPVGGRLPRNYIYSIEEKLGLDRIARHCVGTKELAAEEIVRWEGLDNLPSWVRRSFIFWKKSRFIVNNVVIGPNSGAIWTTSGDVLAESIGSLNKALTFGKVLPDLCSKPVTLQCVTRAHQSLTTRHTHPSLYLACPPTNYFHWMFEVLPGLILLLDEFPDAAIVVPPSRPGYVDACLQCLLGEDGMSSQLVESSRPVAAPLAAFITMPPASGFIRPADAMLVRSTMFRLLGIELASRPARKLFISRRGSRARMPTNQSSIEESFAADGYELLQLEKLPWSEQVTAFSQASTIAGLHGAGFSNLVFAPADCRIQEIFPVGYTNDCYARLAGILRMQYSLVVA